MKPSTIGLAALAAVLIAGLAGSRGHPLGGLDSESGGVMPLFELKLGVGRWFGQFSLVRVNPLDKRAVAFYTTTGVAGAVSQQWTPPVRGGIPGEAVRSHPEFRIQELPPRSGAQSGTVSPGGRE